MVMENTFDVFDTEAWKRRDAFRFFSTFDDPFFSICTQIDVTSLLRQSREMHAPFSLVLLHRAMEIANGIEAFRLRSLNGQVHRYHCIRPACTIRREDETFFFCYFEFEEGMSVQAFVEKGMLAIENQRNLPGMGDRSSVQDVIHFSILPWTSFTGLKHARHSAFSDSIPKVVFGKYFESDGRMKLPVSLDADHALMDGWHASKFFEGLEQPSSE